MSKAHLEYFKATVLIFFQFEEKIYFKIYLQTLNVLKILQNNLDFEKIIKNLEKMRNFQNFEKNFRSFSRFFKGFKRTHKFSQDFWKILG